eukprot:2801461-Pyramimonas_sp.AAC.1
MVVAPAKRKADQLVDTDADEVESQDGQGGGCGDDTECGIDVHAPSPIPNKFDPNPAGDFGKRHPSLSGRLLQERARIDYVLKDAACCVLSSSSSSGLLL